MQMSKTITIQNDRGLFGWIRNGGCENPACKKAMRAGRHFHAVPAAFAVTLPDYHFATATEAEAALLGLPTREERGVPNG
jgi:hypothetical protein